MSLPSNVHFDAVFTSVVCVEQSEATATSRAHATQARKDALVVAQLDLGGSHE